MPTGFAADAAARRPTIADVAARAGVSRAAVSKVLRNAYGVSDEMRTRVGEAIDALEYRPSIAARGLRGTTETVGVVLPDYENDFFGDILDGLTAELGETRFQVILAPMRAGAANGKQAIEALVDRRVDGILAVSPLAEVQWLERIASTVPLVELGRHDDSVNYDTIVGDDRMGAEQVMNHLLELGHRRIAHLTRLEHADRDHPTTTTAIRANVYLERMARAGLEAEIRIIDSAFDQRSAARAMAAALQAPNPPTAVFASNDQAAFGVIRAIGAAGAISVVGYDDSYMAGHPSIDLTSVSQDGESMGRWAVRLLLERIRGRTAPVHRVMTPRLVVRSSSQPLGAGSPTHEGSTSIGSGS